MNRNCATNDKMSTTIPMTFAPASPMQQRVIVQPQRLLASEIQRERIDVAEVGTAAWRPRMIGAHRRRRSRCQSAPGTARLRPRRTWHFPGHPSRSGNIGMPYLAASHACTPHSFRSSEGLGWNPVEKRQATDCETSKLKHGILSLLGESVQLFAGMGPDPMPAEPPIRMKPHIMTEKQIRNDPIEMNCRSGSPDAHDHPDLLGRSIDRENPPELADGCLSPLGASISASFFSESPIPRTSPEERGENSPFQEVRARRIRSTLVSRRRPCI